jgi:hypothetical protein
MHVDFFDDLLTKQMTRKEFLMHLGVLLFALTGISAALKTLSDPHLMSRPIKPNRGFGAGGYGR